ncbi:MAG TPA: type IV secretory system conjugative DNA transfer family protein [Edaphobacter sp.]
MSLPQQNRPRPRNDADDAMLLAWLFLFAIAGVFYYVAYCRFHLRAPQLIELTVYPLLAAVFLYEWLRYAVTRKARMEEVWPRPVPYISPNEDRKNVERAREKRAILLGYDIYGEPITWSNDTRTFQANCFGMTGGGKTTLLHSITEQDIYSGAPIIFIDGKGDWELFEKLLPAMEAAGRIRQLRVINPMRPDISASYNPFWSVDGNYENHISFIFESFKMEKDFFEGHQRVYLENIARILHYTGKRFNFHDVLVAAYDQEILSKQIKLAMDRTRDADAITDQQRLTLQMSVRNLLESFGDRERVAKIQGLINNLMTFMADDLALITGPYDDLLSLDDVIEQKLILYVSLNVNVNERAVTALGRMLLQNLQLMIGKRYAEAQKGKEQPFVSVVMDEFSPFAYENFAHILVTARGANVAFLFALQSAPQLLQVGRGFRNDVASAPNTTFMLRIKDEETAQDFLKASARIRQLRRSMRIRKSGVFQTTYKEEGDGSQTEIKETLAQEEHIKRMPTGQMEMLSPDRLRGVVHQHVHIRQPYGHWFPDVPENLYPKYQSCMDESHGLNLRFLNPELEEKRTRQGRKRS